jgi:hypothetical protein
MHRDDVDGVHDERVEDLGRRELRRRGGVPVQMTIGESEGAVER